MAMTPQERLDYLTAVASYPSGRGRITHAWVTENIGLGVADGIHGALNTLSPPAAARYATGNGVDTTAAWWKARVTAAASNEAIAPHLETLRDFESIYQLRWQAEGYESEPTLADVTKQAIVDTTRTTINAKATAINAWLDAADLSAYTEATLQTYCDSLLASADGNP